jgi:hypothetical protein
MEYAVAQAVGAGHLLAAEIVSEVYFGIVTEARLRDGRILIYNYATTGLELRWIVCPKCNKPAHRDTDLEYNASDCDRCNGQWLQNMLEEG